MNSVTNRPVELEKCGKQCSSSRYESGDGAAEGGSSTRSSCRSPPLFENLEEDASQERKAVNNELHKHSTISLCAKKCSRFTLGNKCSEKLEGEATKSTLWPSSSSIHKISKTARSLGISLNYLNKCDTLGPLVNRGDNKNGEELASMVSTGTSACYGRKNYMKFKEESGNSTLAELDLSQDLGSPIRPYQNFQCHSGSQNLQMQCMQEGGVEIKRENLNNYIYEKGNAKDLYSPNTLRDKMYSPILVQNNDNHFLGANEGCQQDEFDAEFHEIKSENNNAFSNNCTDTIHSGSEALLADEALRSFIALPESSGIPSSVRPSVKRNNVQECSLQNKIHTVKTANREHFPPVSLLIQKEYLEREKKVLIEQSECIELQRLNILCSFSGDSGKCSKLLEVNEFLKTELKPKICEINNKLIKLNERLSVECSPDTVEYGFNIVKSENCPEFTSDTGCEFSNRQKHMDLHPSGATIMDAVAERNDPLLNCYSTVEIAPGSHSFRVNRKRKLTEDESLNRNTDYTVGNDNIRNLQERRSKKVRKDLGNTIRTSVLKEEFLQRAAQVNWCRLCNMFFSSLASYVDHLVTLEHLQRRKVNDGSWLRKVPQVEPKHLKQEELQDVYGVEYLDCVCLFFCNLCEVFIWDREEVMFHPSSSHHVDNFKRHVSENVQRELNFFQRKTAAYKKYCGEQELESDATNKENEIPSEHCLGSGSFIAANTFNSSIEQNVVRTPEAKFPRSVMDKGTVVKVVSTAIETVGRTDVNTNVANIQDDITNLSGAEALEHTAAVCFPSTGNTVASVHNRSDTSIIATGMKRLEEADESIAQSLSYLTKDAPSNVGYTKSSSPSMRDITRPVKSHECRTQSFSLSKGVICGVCSAVESSSRTTDTSKMADACESETEVILPPVNTFVCSLNREVETPALAKKNLIVKPNETIVKTSSLPSNNKVSSVDSTRSTLCPLPSLREMVKYEGETFNSNFSALDKLELVESTKENTVSYSSVNHGTVAKVLNSENTLVISTPVTEVVKDEIHQHEDQMHSIQADTSSEGVVVVKEETATVGAATGDVTTHEESISCIPNLHNNLEIKNEPSSQIIASDSLEIVGSANSKAKVTVVNIEPCKDFEGRDNSLPASAEIDGVTGTSVNMKRKEVQRINSLLHTEVNIHLPFQPSDKRVEEDMETLRNLTSSAENSQMLQVSKSPKDSLVTSNVNVRRPDKEGCENIRILRVFGKPYRKSRKLIRFEDDLRLVCENVKPEPHSPEKLGTDLPLRPIRQNVKALESLSNSTEKDNVDKNIVSSKATCKFIQVIKSASKISSCEVSNLLKAPASSVIIKEADLKSCKVGPSTTSRTIAKNTRANCSEANTCAHSVHTTEKDSTVSISGCGLPAQQTRTRVSEVSVTSVDVNLNIHTIKSKAVSPVGKVKVSQVNNGEALPVNKLVETLVTPKKNFDVLSDVYRCDNVTSSSENITAERSDVEELISNAETEDKLKHSYLEVLKHSGAIQISHRPITGNRNLKLANTVQPNNSETCSLTHNIQNGGPCAVSHSTVKTSSDTSQETHTVKLGPRGDPRLHENFNISSSDRPRISLSEYRKRKGASKNVTNNFFNGFRSALGEYRIANNKRVGYILKKNYQELQSINQETSDHNNSCNKADGSHHLHSEDKSESNNLSSSYQSQKNVPLDLDFLLSPSPDAHISPTEEMTPQSSTRLLSKRSQLYLDLSSWRPEPEQLSQVAVAAHIAQAAIEARKTPVFQPNRDILVKTNSQAVNEACVTAASKPKKLTASIAKARIKTKRNVWRLLKVLLVGDSRLENCSKRVSLKGSAKKVVCIPRLQLVEALAIIIKEMSVETYNAVFIMVGHADITFLGQACGCKNPYEYLTMRPCTPKSLFERIVEVNTNLKALYPKLYILWGSLYPIDFLKYNNSLALIKRCQKHDCNLNMFSYVQSIKLNDNLYNEFAKEFVKLMKTPNIPFIDLKNCLRTKRVRALGCFTNVLCDGVHVKKAYAQAPLIKVRERIILYFMQIGIALGKNGKLYIQY